MYRNPSLPLSRHLDHLTPFRPIGFLSNKPHNGDVCAGYFFLRREAASFLTDWWNVKAPSVNMQRLWEQDALQQLLKNGRAGKRDGGHRRHSVKCTADHVQRMR